MRSALRALNRTSAKGRRLWLIGLAWSARGPASRYQAPGSTPAEREQMQARYLRKAYRRLFDASSDYGVYGAARLTLADFVPPRRRTDNKWYHHSGLFRSGGAPRPAWKAAKCVTGAGTCQY